LPAKGKDVTIVSFSMGMRYATQATEKLVAAGVDVELIDLRTLRPMDSDTVIESVKKTGRWSRWKRAGRRAASAPNLRRVMEQAFDYLDAP
jgi:pyruvate dehydrogenase E1 component beta subunit